MPIIVRDSIQPVAPAGIRRLQVRKLQVPAKPALVIRKLTVPSKRKATLADTELSLDERTQLIIDQIIDEANYLEDDDTRQLWMDGVETFRKSGNVQALVDLTKWRRKVVPLDEFLFSDTYLALNEGETYPGVLEACFNIDTEKYIEVVLKGALGGGKSTIANYMTARNIYKLSCMRHPQSTYGINSKSSLVFTIQSIRLATAKKAVFEEFGKYIRDSPYFKNVYPFDPLVTSQMIFKEQHVSILPVASSSTGAISMNVIGGILDEMNFMQKIKKSNSSNADDQGSFDQAKQVYENITRRRKSRFAKNGKLPGMMFLVSSSRFPDDFTELKANEAEMCGGTDPTIYVSSKSVWESKGRDQFMPESFRVQIGNSSVRSKVLAENEEPDKDCEVIEVPMDFHSDFVKNTDDCLRDFAGVTTLSTRPFMSKRNMIYTAMANAEANGFLHPFTYTEYDFSRGVPVPDPKKIARNLECTMFRHVHVDLGHKRDACGIAMGFINGQKLIERTNSEGFTTTELMPQIVIDFALRIVPPRNGEIEFALIREFLLMLRSKGFPIEYVTYDGFQSVDSRQILRNHNFKADELSVDKTVLPYRALRDAIYDGRIMFAKNEFAANEMAGLEYVLSNGKDKVDHRANGTKDVSDAICGVASFLLTRKVGWSPAMQRKNTLVGHNGGPAMIEEGEQLVKRAPDHIRQMVFRKSVTRKNVSRK